MAHLIDKDALVAEMERRGNICQGVAKANEDNEFTHLYYEGKTEAYSEMSDFLNTIEVKEVDLKQLYRGYINKTYTEEFAQSILDDNVKGDLDSSDLFGIMFYGFELGLSVSNKAQKGEEV